MPSPATAVDRLNLLLPYLNDDHRRDDHRDGQRADGQSDYRALRRAVGEFVASFDGSVEAGHVAVVGDPRPAFMRKGTNEPTDDELEELEVMLRLLLEQGFGDDTLADLSFPVASLRFAVRAAGRPKPKWRNSVNGKRVLAGGAKALRDYRAAGAYVVQVHGPIGELVPFLVAHLLTQTDMVGVHRCERPGCPRFFVKPPGSKGRPQRFCGPACALLHRENQPNKQKPKKRRTR